MAVNRQINRLSMILDDRCTNEIESLFQMYSISNKQTFYTDCIRNNINANELENDITQIERRFGLRMQPVDRKKFLTAINSIFYISDDDLDTYIQSEISCLWDQIKDCTCLNLRKNELFDWVWHKSPIKEKSSINKLKNNQVFKFWFFSTIYHLIYGKYE